MSFIKVEYSVYSTTWMVNKILKSLTTVPVLSFDVETRGVYSPEVVAEAITLLKHPDELTNKDRIITRLIANNSGLSYPSLIKTTHFIFGLSEKRSIILIVHTANEELNIWNWLASYKGKLIIHNTLYDLRIMYERIGKLPNDYEDTQLLTKSLINNSDTWKSKVGLKELMGEHYDPKWVLYNDYDVTDYKDKNFLNYGAIDGAATFKLWEQLMEHITEKTNDK